MVEEGVEDAEVGRGILASMSRNRLFAPETGIYVCFNCMPHVTRGLRPISPLSPPALIIAR